METFHLTLVESGGFFRACVINLRLTVRVVSVDNLIVASLNFSLLSSILLVDGLKVFSVAIMVGA